METELFFPLEGSPALALMCWGALVAFISAVACIVAIAASDSRPDATKEQRKQNRAIRYISLAVAVPLTVGGVISMIAGHEVSQDTETRYQTIRDNRQLFFTERGVFVSPQRFPDLEFPAYEPTGDQQFGVALAEHDGSIVSVRLAWENGEMVLFDADGELLEPIL